MALFFFCPCGQDLRTPEEQAGGYTRCPACCRLVRSPSLGRANQALGIETPLINQVTPSSSPPPPVAAILPVPALKVVEISSTNFEPAPRKSLMLPSDQNQLTYALRAGADVSTDYEKKAARKKIRQVLTEAERRLEELRRHPRGWRLERWWFECLIYPVRAVPQLAVLATLWATLIAAVVAFLPEHWEAFAVPPRTPLLVFLFVLLGYTLACLQETLVAGNAGQAGYVAWPSREFGRIARCGAQGVFCLLAGPIVPALVAYFFWLESGDLKTVDWLILWELGIVAFGYWTLAFWAVQRRGRWRDAHPLVVVRLVRRSGHRVGLAALIMAAALVGHGLLMLGAVVSLHHGVAGWFLLALEWTSLLACLVFALRWLGVSQFYARRARLKNNKRFGAEAANDSDPRVPKLKVVAMP